MRKYASRGPRLSEQHNVPTEHSSKHAFYNIQYRLSEILNSHEGDVLHIIISLLILVQIKYQQSNNVNIYSSTLLNVTELIHDSSLNSHTSSLREDFIHFQLYSIISSKTLEFSPFHMDKLIKLLWVWLNYKEYIY